MSMGSQIYGAYMCKRSPGRRKRVEKKRVARTEVICPFTLEAVRNCSIRKRVPRVACSFSLESCLAPR